ncbi:MAG: tetratricopeptide repeat protein [Sterolibacterium sp.]|nr:tetratricopeptide repeat protein [Sterolibacterium sp.]
MKPQEINALVALFNAGRYAEAESQAREMTARFPDYGFGWKVWGAALKQIGRSSDALAPMRKAAALLPNDAEAHNNLGANLHDLGRPGEAETSFRQAVKIKPDFAEAHYNLSNPLLDLGRPGEAETSCRRALDIRPNYAEAYQNLAAALADLGKLDESVNNAKKSLALNPNNEKVLYQLHALLLDHVDLKPCIHHMKRVVALKPEVKAFRFFLGCLLEYAGDKEAASVHLESVSAGSDRERALLDAWNYIKASCTRMPPILGSSIRTFQLGIDSAPSTGLVLEFGVRHGTSIRQIASLVAQEVHGFDSFEGLPEAWHDEPRGSYSTNGRIPAVPENVILHKGWFEDTIPGFLKKHGAPVRFMNIDCDIYSSTKTILELFAERILPGTVIVFDEYIGNKRWREDEFKAFQEAADKYAWSYEYLGFSFCTKQVVLRIMPGNTTGKTGI